MTGSESFALSKAGTFGGAVLVDQKWIVRGGDWFLGRR